MLYYEVEINKEEFIAVMGDKAAINNLAAAMYKELVDQKSKRSQLQINDAYVEQSGTVYKICFLIGGK